ncbi:MAG: hypothetical protein DHS20C01_08860 [marine bacterium B5-7]|nr:MAG: hypothetical protein DHS20C01_08860 [marine bacterium B5-7]
MVFGLDGEFLGRALSTREPLETTHIENLFAAYDIFCRVFAIRPDDTVLFLADKGLDPRVISAIIGLAKARGVTEPLVLMAHSTQISEMPEWAKPHLEKATFVISTWFCSVIDPFAIRMRRDKGQRWVKITYFRNLDLLETPQARFSPDLLGEIIRGTARQYPRNTDFDMHFTDSRGTDLSINVNAEMVDNLLETTRWKGDMFAREDGCYVHYLPCHGPNVYDRTMVKNDDRVIVPINGRLYPQWAVGFERPFADPVEVVFKDDRIVEVNGDGADAAILSDMLVGGTLIELGCGFNPKAPRYEIYPAGSNSPGVLHFGIDLDKPSDYIRRKMPDWEEPPIHMDLVLFDCTVTAGDSVLIDNGYLTSLDDPAVREAARCYGDDVDLLENWPN